MPAIATHYFFALDVYDKLNKQTKIKIIEHFDEYKIGAQGPDIFFYYKPIGYKNDIRAYGQKLHHSPALNFIKTALDNVKENNSELGLSYLLGLISHFCLDSSFHKVINKEAYNFDLHMILEKELDRYYIYKKTNISPLKFKRYLLVDYNNNYYHSFLKYIYPEVNPDISYDAIKEMYEINKLLYSPNGIKKEAFKIVFKGIKAVPYDYSNMIIDIDDEMLFHNTIQKLDSMWPETVDKATKLIENALAYLENKQDLDKYFENDFE
ncbi:zinc dependent phospholipase C family protein [Mycoplasma sp. P36-A1]|uniref:zinc dependent phospholipase C family protein n=1 Tax=Mycoplasma sp. P36-A1 TaxID=3252900 RepID=UPI003C2F7D4B